jgi:hypothetical protein
MSLLDEENSFQQNLGLLYRHISFRATKILEIKKKKTLKAPKGLKIYHGATMMEPTKFGTLFNAESVLLLSGSNGVDTLSGGYKRSNSFKLGPRPRECKD